MPIKLREWMPQYERIRRTLGYSREQDQLAADTLSKLLIKGRHLTASSLSHLIKDRIVLVLGAGPSLEKHVLGLMRLGLLKHFILIVADGATTALLKLAKVPPHIVVTDLDGPVRDLTRASKKGSIMVVHAHGDNVTSLRKLIGRFEKVLGTTQVEPRPAVYNFGGFTDGDRAVFLAEAMRPKFIILAGMDFGKTIGGYSKSRVRSVQVKRRKLQFGKMLIEWLAERSNIEIYNLTGKGERIRGCNHLETNSVPSLIEHLTRESHILES